jgi:hypothetical protein
VRLDRLEVRRLMTAMIAAATLTACSGGDDGGTNPTPTIDLALSAATLSVVQGASGTVTGTLTRAGGFAGDVAVTVEGAPTGVTAAQVTVAANATSGVVTIATTAATAPGTYPLTVRATGNGVTAKTASLSLTVTAAPVPAYTLALAPTTVTVVQGGTGTVGATLTRTGGFTGAVTFAVEGLPAGVTGAFAPNNTTTNASTLTLTAAAGATVGGPTTVTVRTTATGQTDKTATFQLNVTAPTPSSYTLAVTPATVNITQSATATANIALTRTGGFAGAVTFAVEGLPTGVTGAFNPNNTTTDASVLTLTATAAAAVGTSTITVRGTATGQADKTATFQLTVAAPAASYTLAVTPATVAVVQGATATANVALTRTNGFAGAVTFAVEGLPAGVTGAFNPNNTTTDASVLTLTAAAGATVGGPTTITVRGTATGQTDKTATFQLNVTAAPVGGYTLAATSPVTVQQGATGTSTITITRTNGFAGAVTLTTTGLPNGVTAAFNPAAPTTNSSTLTFTASPTATVGAATVTVRGNSGTLAEQTATVALNVTAVTGGSGNTTWEFCNVADMPLWLAVQDGNGAWTRVTPTGTKFQFNIASAKGGVAFVLSTTSPNVASASSSFAARMSTTMRQELLLRNRPTRTSASRSLADAFTLSIFYGSQAELNSQGTNGCTPGVAGKTVNGSVANVGPTQLAFVSLGAATAFVSPASGTTFQLKNVQGGALDLIASRLSIDLTTFATAVDKLIIRRGLNQADGSTITPTLDFNAAEAFAPVTPNLTIGNLNGEVGAGLSLYFTGGFGSGSAAAPLFVTAEPGAGPFKYYGVPAAKQAAGDLHLLEAVAYPSASNQDQYRASAVFFKDATDKTLNLGPALSQATVSAAATAPYVRFRATGAVQSEYNKSVTIDFIQSAAAASRTVSISATAGYLSGLATYDFTIPDFTTVAGWDNNWGPKAGAATEWTVTGTGYTGLGVGTPNPVEGATFLSATRAGTITP